MTIQDTDKTDFLWKKIIFGTAKSAAGSLKAGSNETIPSPLPVYNTGIWAQTDTVTIPPNPPGTATAAIALWYGSSAIEATNDPTSPLNVSWQATTTYGTTSTRIGNFIPPTFGSGYAAQVWIGNPNGGPAARIFPDTTNEEWVFDYNAGNLFFPNSVPGTKTATIGTGSVTVAGNGIYFQLYQYTGVYGFDNSGTSTATITYSTAGTVTVCTVPKNARVVELTIMVNTAFNLATTIQIGNGSNPSALMDATMTDLTDTSLPTFLATPPGVLSTSAGTPVVVTIGGAVSTAGSATVTVSYM